MKLKMLMFVIGMRIVMEKMAEGEAPVLLKEVGTEAGYMVVEYEGLVLEAECMLEEAEKIVDEQSR
ncbi:hypothetical protein LINPERPRIM_LOCUS15063 [Linum perenne]